MNSLPAILATLAPSAMKETAAAPMAPSSLAAAQFNAIMHAAPPSGAQSAAAVSAPTAPAAGDAVNAASLGNQILNGLHRTSTDLSSQWEAIHSTLDASRSPGVTELLQVQTQLLQVSVHYELVGKAISKSTQNIDTLVRMQ